MSLANHQYGDTFQEDEMDEVCGTGERKDETIEN
jgi:hypothetical protein